LRSSRSRSLLPLAAPSWLARRNPPLRSPAATNRLRLLLLLRRQQDLLDKKWEKWANKVEVKSAADGGATFTGALSVEGAKTASSFKRETKEGPVKKFEVSGESEVKAEFVMPVAELAKGAELSFTLADAPRKAGADKVKANGGVTVLQKDLAAGLDFSLKGADRFGVDAFAVTTREKVLFGFSGAAVVGGKDEKDEKKARAAEFSGNAQVAYKSGATLMGAQTDFAKKSVSAFVYNKVSDEVQMAARVSVPVDRKSNPAAAAAVDFGLNFKQGSSETTVKANSAGLVSVCYAEQVNKLAKITLLGQVDATKYSSTDSMKFAAQLNLAL